MPFTPDLFRMYRRLLESNPGIQFRELQVEHLSGNPLTANKWPSYRLSPDNSGAFDRSMHHVNQALASSTY
jgi:hypothetical protein